MSKYTGIFWVFALLAVAAPGHAQVLRKRATMLMGGRFEFTIVAKDSLTAENNIDLLIGEVSRIEHLISDWIPTSQVSQVNANAGLRPVAVDAELFELTERAIALSELTDGAFDISFAAMEKIWKFDGSMTRLPAADEVKKSVARVGYRNIILDRAKSTIFLKKPGMKIGFGALGEGYAADRCRMMMQQAGVPAGIVNATGDMSAWGKQPDGQNWVIGITDPARRGELFAVLPLLHGAVVTSGSYEKFVMLNGKRYSHIINPATGYPATGLMSVTVFGPSTEKANGFSTAMMVLGRKKGLELLSKFPQYSCVIIADNGQVFTSPNLDIAPYRYQ
jgi:thiamine biosynthesis lipoprotein